MDREAKKKLDAEKRRVILGQKAMWDKIAQEPKLTCAFVNLESKGANVEFAFHGHKFNLEDGKEYDLPLSVIEHLNSLKVPVMKFKTDPLTGMLKPETEIKTMLQRFSVTPTNLRAYTTALKGEPEEVNDEGE